MTGRRASRWQVTYVDLMGTTAPRQAKDKTLMAREMLPLGSLLWVVCFATMKGIKLCLMRCCWLSELRMIKMA